VAHELGARKNVHLVGVFDGHRGAEAAEFARTQVSSTSLGEDQDKST
jgi:serine/threonine protein phosphatase PrpC